MEAGNLVLCRFDEFEHYYNAQGQPSQPSVQVQAPQPQAQASQLLGKNRGFNTAVYEQPTYGGSKPYQNTGSNYAPDRINNNNPRYDRDYQGERQGGYNSGRNKGYGGGGDGGRKKYQRYDDDEEDLDDPVNAFFGREADLDERNNFDTGNHKGNEEALEIAYRQQKKLEQLQEFESEFKLGKTLVIILDVVPSNSKNKIDLSVVESALKNKNLGGLKVEDRGQGKFAVRSTNQDQAKRLLGLEGQVNSVYPDL